MDNKNRLYNRLVAPLLYAPSALTQKQTKQKENVKSFAPQGVGYDKNLIHSWNQIETLVLSTLFELDLPHLVFLAQLCNLDKFMPKTGHTMSRRSYVLFEFLHNMLTQ